MGCVECRFRSGTSTAAGAAYEAAPHGFGRGDHYRHHQATAMLEGDCLFCPNDLRMPKSYLHAEPACARAEQNCFDPYLQVSARLTALSQMGHATDKIELIVLGGTWSDYPEGYQTWFMSELFRALNDDAVAGVAANPHVGASGHQPCRGRAPAR